MQFDDHRPKAGNLPIDTPPIAHAKFAIGDVVRHRMFGFRGVIFDIDPVFANSEEWYEAIPEAIRPDRAQPFYHLLAENNETSYVAYASEQNLIREDAGDPVDHPAVSSFFSRDDAGRYRLDKRRWQ